MPATPTPDLPAQADAPVQRPDEGRSLLSRFHRGDQGQILPLVFFLGIAFFTSVVLVINTGRTTLRRVKAQNAIDAAVVSGAGSVARGMNYVASNNITQSKLLASVVILRAFPDAIDTANTTLDVWEVAADIMHALKWIPYGIGAALDAAATVIDIKIEIERPILDALEQVIDPLLDAWDDDGDGAAWLIMDALHYLGEAFVYATPVIAQYTTFTVYGKNIAPETGQGWMLPIYPAMPACRGKFSDFYGWTKHWAEKAAKPIYIAGWALLTLSLFPVWYKQYLKSELNEMFTGQPTDVDTTDPDKKRMDELQAELQELEKERAELEKDLQELKKELAELEEEKADGKDVDGKIQSKKNQIKKVEADIEEVDEKIEKATEEIKEISDRRAGNHGEGQPPDDWDDGLGGMQGTAQERERPRPWLIDPSEYPDSFTYVALGWRDNPQPIVGKHFKRQYATGFTYAAARIYNTIKGDLWTADWRARLVRVEASQLANPLGSLPGNCGDGSQGSGASEISGAGMDAPDGMELQGILSDFVNFLNKH